MRTKLVTAGSAAIALLHALPLLAQQTERPLNGKVVEETSKNKQQTLIGARVFAPVSKTGTLTDTEGHFTLNLQPDDSLLVVSYVGFDNDTISLKPTDTHLKVVLTQPHKLGEVKITHRRKSTEINMLDPIKSEKIGQRELLKAACCNLSESFETTPSVDVAFTDAVTGYRQIQMLGLAGPYTYITRENIPDVRGLASVTGLTFTPGSFIESMQLSKGSGSVVNGFESVAGQINVELKKPFEGDKWDFNLYQNNQGRTEGNIVYNHKLNSKVSTSLMLHGKSQWLKFDQNNDGFLDQPLGNTFVGVNRWFFFSPTGWEVQGGIKATYADNIGGQWHFDKNAETGATSPWGFTLNTQRYEGWAKIGKVSKEKPWRSFGLQLSGTYHNQDALYGKVNYLGKQQSLYGNFIYQSIISNTNHGIKLGMSTIMDKYEEHMNPYLLKRTEVVPGAFAEYSYNYLTKLNIVAGLRGDYNNLYGAFVTPRLHVRYAPWTNTSIRGSVGRSQRTANVIAENLGFLASNRAWFLPLQSGNSNLLDLKPEVAWNTGANITQKFMLNYREGSISADYYYTHFTNQVIVDMETPRQVNVYNLNGNSFAHSFQIQADYEPIRKWDVRLAYRYYDVQSTYNGVQKEKPLIAAHRAFLNTGYETRNNWKFDYTVQWIGPKRVPIAMDDNHMHMPERSPSFIQMSAQVSKTWKDNFEVYLGGENLTNYMQHPMIVSADNPSSPNFDASLIWGPVMGRTIYAGLRYKIK